MAELEGNLVDFLFQDGIKTALLLERNDRKLKVIDVNGRQSTVNQNQLLCTFPETATRNTLAEAVAQLESFIAELQGSVDTALLWEEVADHAAEVPLKQLAQTYFGDGSPRHCSALFRALMQDPIHFKLKNLHIQPRTRAQVDDQLLKQRRLEEKEQFRDQARRWMQDVLGGRAGADEGGTFPDALEDYLLRNKQNEIAKVLESMAGNAPREKAFDVLQECGRLPQDADPLVVVAGIRKSFRPEDLEAAEQVPAYQGDPAREDLSSLETFSIDDEDTQEVDDALSLTKTEEGIELGIHIADVGCFFPPQSSLDHMALERVISIYMPTETITMFPERLSCDLFSLRCDELRPSLSLLVRFDHSGKLLARRFVPSQIRVAHRLSYQQADALLQEGGEGPVEALRELQRLSGILHQQRLDNHALSIFQTELKIRVQDNDIQIKALDTRSPARRLVQEAMILYNSLAGEYALEQKLPVIFRTQQAPEDKGIPYGKEISYPEAEAIGLFRSLKPARLSLVPKPHAGLGVDHYIQLTSPIRRFSDIVMQRQVAAAACGQPPPYLKDDLWRILVAAETTEKEISAIEKRAKRYWCLEYLLRQGEDVVHNATVVSQKPAGNLVETQDPPIRGYLPGKTNLKPGQKVTVRINKVLPRKNLLYFREA